MASASAPAERSTVTLPEEGGNASRGPKSKAESGKEQDSADEQEDEAER